MSYKYCVLCGAVADVALFKFPKEQSLFEQWKEFCRNIEIKNHHKLCAIHFEKDDILELKSKKQEGCRYNLRKTAVPQLNYIPGIAKRRRNLNPKTSKKCLLCDCNDPKLSYFPFPKDNENKTKWLLFCEFSADDAINLGCRARLCEKHFEEKDILRKQRISGGIIDRLESNAVPKIFDPNNTGNIRNPEVEVTVDVDEVTVDIDDITPNTIQEVTPTNGAVEARLLELESDEAHFNNERNNSLTNDAISTVKRIIHTNCTACENFLLHISHPHPSNHSASTSSQDHLPTTPTVSDISRKRRISYVGDVTTPDLATPKRAKRCFNLAKTEVFKSRRRIDVMKKKMKRMESNVKQYRSLLEHLKKENLLSESASIGLLHGLPISMQRLIERQIVKKNEPYSPELRAFAVTLQFYSPKAYDYVRKTWMNLLPHETTLRKWYARVDGSPGLTSEAFRALKCRHEEQPAVCCLVIDEMSIKDYIEHDRKKVYGYQDLGTDLNIDSDILPHAKHALVFLLVSLKENWKIPIAYFLIHSLNGAERANLVHICLKQLAEVNVNVVALTFDGTAVNISMCEHLGAKFTMEENEAQFLNPVTKSSIFMYPDPCHMIKLVRNALGEMGPFFNESADEISWSYIQKLHELEDTEGLRAATKLTHKHINYERNKMNVRLAAQVMSASVKDALLWAKDDMAMENFQNAGATAEFCGVINDAFDILNCRSRFSKKPFQKPVSEETMPQIQSKIDESVKYIKKLMVTKLVIRQKEKNTVTYQELVESCRKTGFVGLIICLQNLIPIYREVTEKIPGHQQHYLLSYKLLQDSIENFFSAIRSRGGFNNNPTCRSFEWAYKRLLVHHEIQRRGNCELDNIQFLRSRSAGISTVDPVCDLNEEGTDVDTSDIDGDTCSYEKLSRIVGDVNQHIAGCIVHILYKKKVCEKCRPFLEMKNHESSSKLTNRKNRGYLKSPSADVCKVTEMAERIFRVHSHLFSKKNLIETLVFKTYLATAQDVFTSEEMKAHVVEQELFEDHRSNLIKLIARIYLEIRFLHETRKLNRREQYIRQEATHRVTIYNNQ